MPLIPEEEYTIAQLATTIAANFGDKQVEFDHTKADGQHRKSMSNEAFRSRLANFKFRSLEEGIRLTVQDYVQNKHTYRHGESPSGKL